MGNHNMGQPFTEVAPSHTHTASHTLILKLFFHESDTSFEGPCYTSKWPRWYRCFQSFSEDPQRVAVKGLLTDATFSLPVDFGPGFLQAHLDEQHSVCSAPHTAMTMLTGVAFARLVKSALQVQCGTWR
eukprot:2325305-Amphidinium_carterae.1